MEKLNEILEVDKKYRIKENVLNDEDLYTFDDLLAEDRSVYLWDYSCPTLMHWLKRNKDVFNNMYQIKFNKEFYNRYPFIKSINLSNVLVAGGCISNILMFFDNDESDIDLFFYDMTEMEANLKVEEILDTLSKYKKIKDISRNDFTITFFYEDKKIQIITRIFSSKSEILHGFDLGSSAVGFDGDNVYFTSLAKYSYINECNIIDTTRRSTTYEKRLIKYFNRGFDIIIPKLKIDNNYLYYELPFFIITLENESQNNKLVVRDIKCAGKHKVVFDYGTTEDDTNEYSLFYKKLSSLFGSIYLFEPSNYSKVIEGRITIKEKNIDICYNNLLNSILKNSEFPINSIKKYLPLSDINEVFMNRENKEYIKNEIKKHKEFVNKKIKEIYPIKWNIANPGTQLIGAINPIIEEESLWYGKWYNGQIHPNFQNNDNNDNNVEEIENIEPEYYDDDNSENDDNNDNEDAYEDVD